MTIITGSATVDQTGRVVLDANSAFGFGTARGVRLSNFTGDTLILYNISGTDQSKEYLAPQTQMVYTTDNIGQNPFIVGYSTNASAIANGLLVEWSSDPQNDFIGTYPVALPTSSITPTDTNGGVILANGSVPSLGNSLTVAIPPQYKSVFVSASNASWLPSLYYYWLDESSQIITSGVVADTTVHGYSEGNSEQFVANFRMNAIGAFLMLAQNTDGGTAAKWSARITGSYAEVTDLIVPANTADGPNALPPPNQGPTLMTGRDNTTPAQTVGVTELTSMIPHKALMGGPYHLRCSAPSDTAFYAVIGQWENGAGYPIAQPIGSASTSILLCDSSEGVTAGTDLAIDKIVNIPPLFYGKSCSYYAQGAQFVYINVTTASATTANINIELDPVL